MTRAADAEVQPDRAAWDAALANFLRVESEYDQLCDAEEKAGEAVADACPRVDRYFDEYQLGMGMERPDVLQTITIALHGREFDIGAGIPFYPKEARDAYEAKSQEISAEAERLTEEFMVYQQRSADARKLYGVDELEAHARAYRPLFFQVRDALMRLPAPDNDALLVKIELAAVSLDSGHAESTLADARRLLGRA